MKAIEAEITSFPENSLSSIFKGQVWQSICKICESKV